MPSTKPINYIADRTKLAELSTTVKKSVDTGASRYTSPFAVTGEKVAQETYKPNMETYNQMEQRVFDEIAKANEELAKSAAAKTYEPDPSTYLG